jgi:hypothetical protein
VRSVGALVLGLALGCAPPPAGIEDLIEVGGLVDERVLLEVTDEDGAAIAVGVEGDDGPRSVQTPFELPCAGGLCSLDVQVPRGILSFTLLVVGEDRCATEATLYTIPAAENPVDIGPFDLEIFLTFAAPDLSLDDDGDDIPNAFEPLLCGRFDAPDHGSAAASCAGGDPCCAASALIGQASAFPGDDVTPPFSLGATEVPVGVAARCVATGGCPRAAANPGFLDEIERAAFDLPATALLPDEAAEVCAWLGGRLPTDDEWLHAADAAAPYPWGDDTTPGCRTDDALGVNYAAAGVACNDRPMPVGSFASSNVERGAGAPVADLAGNVFEWTVVPGSNAGDEGFPDDAGALVLRGGAFDSPLDLLRNDLSFRVSPGDDGRVRDLVATGTTGFRCAFEDAPTPEAEPACP